MQQHPATAFIRRRSTREPPSNITYNNSKSKGKLEKNGFLYRKSHVSLAFARKEWYKTFELSAEAYDDEVG